MGNAPRGIGWGLLFSALLWIIVGGLTGFVLFYVAGAR